MYFIPEQPGADSEYIRRMRLVAFAITITSGFALFYVGVSWVCGFSMGMKIMAGCFLGDIIALLLLRFKVDAFTTANFFGLVGSLSIFGCTYFSGGVYSPVFPWLVETPVVLLLIAGKKGGYFWLIISLAMAVVFGVLSYAGFVFPLDYNTSSKTFFFLTCNSGLVLIIFFISIIFENFRIGAYNEVFRQKDELQTALSDLKKTQSQLIQAEKMASLGELTAGIAHEIQNPLNFVNNFSEINTELIEELQGEGKKRKNERNETLIEDLLHDIAVNEEKINHHGKRADAIVKGMLQHSRSSGAGKKPTDINVLTEEYLRLAYHGLRAKDNSLHVTVESDFDKRIGRINIVPQDIGRVLINLINNAFYAVAEKAKQNLDGYKPSVMVTTHSVKSPSGDSGVEIRVRDNGNGIPDDVKKKIFQPFFTTKPAGQGTGLGLSMSYDIVKAHGGDIKVETKEGDGTQFIITVPSGENT